MNSKQRLERVWNIRVPLPSKLVPNKEPRSGEDDARTAVMTVTVLGVFLGFYFLSRSEDPFLAYSGALLWILLESGVWWAAERFANPLPNQVSPLPSDTRQTRRYWPDALIGYSSSLKGIWEESLVGVMGLVFLLPVVISVHVLSVFQGSDFLLHIARFGYFIGLQEILWSLGKLHFRWIRIVYVSYIGCHVDQPVQYAALGGLCLWILVIRLAKSLTSNGPRWRKAIMRGEVTEAHQCLVRLAFVSLLVVMISGYLTTGWLRLERCEQANRSPRERHRGLLTELLEELRRSESRESRSEFDKI